MSVEKSSTREKIIKASIELIEKHGDVEKVNIRDIAASAGVGVGSINYHFNSKEKLLNLCVQQIISNVIAGFQPLYQGLEMEPLDKLKFLINSTCSFLVSNPGLSRVSILTDMKSANPEDNSRQTYRAYLPVVKEVCAGKRSDKEIFILLHTLISALQVAFLRRDTIKSTEGLDFFNQQQREELVELIVDNLFAGCSD